MPRVNVKDFGPIAEANVDLRPLTVFIGPNNSGKSYLALAIYCLSRTLSGGQTFVGGWSAHFGSISSIGFTEELLKNTKDKLKEAWPNANSLPRRRVKVGDLPEGVQAILFEATQSFANSMSSNFAGELQRCYGRHIGTLVRQGSTVDTEKSLKVGISDAENGFDWEMQSSGKSVITTDWDNMLSQRTIDFRDDLPSYSFFIDDPEFFLYSVTNDLNLPIVARLLGRAHYMPASRSGILLGHKTLAGLIVGQASRAWLQPMEIPRLPGVVTDLIQALLLFSPDRVAGNRPQEVVDFLEREVAGGIVDLDVQVEYPEIYYENAAGRFLLHEVSSMVSEVAPIVLYLKYLVRPGQLFIIEEPESHIDSDNQRKLARAIAMLVNAGVNVLITTHSDYFVNQLNNLLSLSQVLPRRRPRRTYSRNEILDPEKVVAYWFEPGDEGSTVQKLEVTGEEGIPTFSFTDTHSALYDEAIALEHLPRLS